MSYSVIELFFNASLIVQLVIIFLLLASIISWMIIFERWIYLYKSKQELTNFEDFFWSDAGLEAVFKQGGDEDPRLMGMPLNFDGIRPPLSRYAPSLGEDNDEIKKGND